MSENPMEDFVNLFMDERQEEAGQPEEQRAAVQNQRLANALQTLAGGATPELRDEVGAFLSGQGGLLETTRAAVAKSGGTGVNSVAKMLTKTFKLKEPLASLVATLLVKVLPGVIEKTTQESAAKTKPKKKKTATSKTKPRKAKASTGKKTATKPKKADSAAKPKKAKASAGKKTVTKPKTTQKTAAKTTKKKTASRAEEISE